MGIDRKFLGGKLRQARESAGLTGPELARQLSVNQSTISRFESGRIRPEADFIREYIAALDLPKAASMELQGVTEAFLYEFDRWNSEKPGELAGLQQVALRFEKNSRQILSYTNDIIPGLLQTPQYIDRLFFSLGEKDHRKRKLAIRARLMRRAVLKRRDKEFKAIVSEAAFNHPAISKSIIKRQVSALNPWLTGGNALQLFVLPYTAKLEYFPMNGFYIHDGKFVFVETQTRGLSLWFDEEVQSYCRLFDGLLRASITGNQAHDCLAKYR